MKLKEGNCPYPYSVYNTQMGFSQNKKKNHFDDLHCETLQTLETKDYMRLQVNKYSEPGEPIPIYCLEKQGDRLLAADESGQFHVVRGWFGSGAQFDAKHPAEQSFVNSTCLTSHAAVNSLKPIGGKVAAGTGNGHLCILDLDTLELIRMYDSHEKSIKKVDSFNTEILVTCSRDNRINVHDLRVKSDNPVNTINHAHNIVHCDNISNSRSKSNANASSSSNSVTDVVFIDEHNLISCGAADGLLKQWDLRVTYKHMKKFHPVHTIEYPEHSNAKGYGCLKVINSKLFASSVKHEIFQFDLSTKTYEATYLSPSKLSYFTKLDVSYNGNYLAAGSEENKVHLFKTVPIQSKEIIHPVHTLVENNESDLPVCCVVFSPEDDLMVTTGGDSSIVSKWIPRAYLYSSREEGIRLFKDEKENPPKPLPEIKTEFKYLYRKNKNNSSNKMDSKVLEKSQDLRLDSFPNYVIDGMRLPHVHPRIKIKLRKLTTASNWLKSPEPSKNVRRIIEQETTPKSRNSKKRKRLCDDNNLSPKIFEFFKVSTTPTH